MQVDSLVSFFSLSLVHLALPRPTHPPARREELVRSEARGPWRGVAAPALLFRAASAGGGPPGAAEARRRRRLGRGLCELGYAG